MGKWMKLTAADGHELNAYLAEPAGEARGAIVVLQEIFGVNASIRAVADHFVGLGYLAIAPATTDRVEPGLELGYSPEELRKAFSVYPNLDPEKSLMDVAAAFAAVKGKAKSVGVVGFCYGGLMSWLSATRGEAHGFEPACTVAYYPGGIGSVAAETPACPVMVHIGSADEHIAHDQVEALQKANHPQVQLFLYEGALHAFSNPDRPSYDKVAADEANRRTDEFFRKHLG